MILSFHSNVKNDYDIEVKSRHTDNLVTTCIAGHRDNVLVQEETIVLT